MEKSTSILVGKLFWVSSDFRYGCALIAILLSCELAPAVNGKEPLRSIRLSAEATEVLQKHWYVTCLEGVQVEVEVYTEDISSDLEAGKGLRGKQPFMGKSITFL